jgi:hypothetical protein
VQILTLRTDKKKLCRSSDSGGVTAAVIQILIRRQKEIFETGQDAPASCNVGMMNRNHYVTIQFSYEFPFI